MLINMELNALRLALRQHTNFKYDDAILQKQCNQSIYKVAFELNKISSPSDKCFTYVTKTIANLTMYSRKPGDYNGTITFEIDIMKNSSPINLKFTLFAMSKPKQHFFST